MCKLERPRIKIVRPQRRFETEFVAAARRSRGFHRSWGSPPATEAGFRAYLARQRSDRYVGRFLIEAGSGALVGVVNINEIVRGSFQSAYLGYYLFAPYEGRGLMGEGLCQVMRMAFRELRLHRLEANIQPNNARSIALVKNLGFRLEGLSPRYLKIGGRWRDHERWAVSREEFRGGG